MNKTFFYISCVLLLLVTSCKKTTPIVEPNQSTIKHFTLNLFYDASVNAVLQNIDFNKDSNFDFELLCDRHYGFSSSRISLSRVVSTFFPMDFAIKNEGIGSGYPINILLEENGLINEEVGIWQPNSVLFLSDVLNPSLGLNNKGPKYIPIRFRNIQLSSSDYYYGWIKVDVSDKYKVNIMEAAFQTQVNTTLKAGEK